MIDAIVIGAGLGGLACASKLVRAGLDVLVLEKIPHIGGTSFVFRRGPFEFPMGPLAFSFPGRVRRFLEESGADGGLSFRRNHFQLVSPYFDIVYSRPLGEFRDELAGLYPAETVGLDRVFADLTSMIDALREERAAPSRLQSWSTTPASTLLDRHLRDVHLKALLGSMGTSPPDMSLLNLAVMWRVMSVEGIWFPEGGIDGLCRLLETAVRDGGGEIRLSSPVETIVVENGRAVGVRTPEGGVIRAEWIVSNADYKTTFLELLRPADVPAPHLELVKRIPYTESELCVYLGVDRTKVDLGRLRATHLFTRHEERPPSPGDEEDFDNQEIEVCLWTENAPSAAPEGRAVLLLRVQFPYETAADWRTGEKSRKAGYREYKLGLARKLIKTVERVLPGLSESVEVMDAATPLTYRDWGRRFAGSIAGWTWSGEAGEGFREPFLVRTPVENLLAVGVYAARELVFGGVPTAFHTADLAAEMILRG